MLSITSRSIRRNRHRRAWALWSATPSHLRTTTPPDSWRIAPPKPATPARKSNWRKTRARRRALALSLLATAL